MNEMIVFDIIQPDVAKKVLIITTIGHTTVMQFLLL